MGIGRFFGRDCAAIALLLAAVLGLTGCPEGGNDGNVNQEPPDGDNSTFGNAMKVVLSANDQSIIEGEISGPSDVDLYEIGPLSPGDHVLADVQAISGNLDAVAALFDSREYVHGFNDDRSFGGADLNPLLDLVVRGPDGPYYIGIVAFPGSNTTGRYRISLRITRGVGVPEPEPQTVFLEWRGGANVLIQNVGRYDLPPFDAAVLGKEFAGQTDVIKRRVRQLVADRFRGFGLIILSSDDNAKPATPHSTIYFGGQNNRAFAISQQIDTFNGDRGDDAIVFTESYRGAFGATPTAEQISTALANTVAHEIGHLLGLVHTRECSELMDTRCGNQALLFEQSFGVAPLDSSVFPLGFQNAAELIGWTIGLVGL
jgi:hypothetical protein